ncbi:MAG: glycoside hydrolase family 43 protein [Planctomycetaceae bacterium]|nr:glycoside hydrolase family 43 protein [Planctomycetaceae bacterium]
MKRCLLMLSCLLPLYSCFAMGENNSQTDNEAVYLFSYFHDNGQDGLHLAFSANGLTWTALKNDESFLKPQVGSKLMRDPSICRGPDGVFHMVWTTGWWDRGIGVAHSKDLVNWSEQQFLEVMKNEPNAKNCWAPELFYDEATETFLVFWSTTIPGRFPETELSKDDNNHRVYYVSTRDFKTFSDTALFLDPGFNVIDAFMAKDEANGRYVLFIKNETKAPKAEKNIRVTFSDKATGPWGPVSAPITGNYWAEGPAALCIKGKWLVYFDMYRDRKYGAVLSNDLITWKDISDQVRLPAGIKHGTTFKADRTILEALNK